MDRAFALVGILTPFSGAELEAASDALRAAGRLGDDAAQVTQNAAKGKAFENKFAAELEADGWTVSREVTLETAGGARTRMDIVAKRDAALRCVECKSSATAPLTRGQELAHPQIAATGATVVGRGKPAVPGGTQLPPTKVEIIRP